MKKNSVLLEKVKKPFYAHYCEWPGLNLILKLWFLLFNMKLSFCNEIME